MYRMTEKETELKKLYDLLDKVRVAILGSDYQTRMQMKEIEEKVILKIKSIRSNTQ